jgi:hypothetical protein
VVKQRKKFRKKIKTAELCLINVAKALDECNKHKVEIKLRHGIVMSDYGYVLPFKRRWMVRMMVDSGYKLDDDEDSD